MFFGDTLIGARMPNLTYMLSFADQADLEAEVGGLPQRSGMEETLRQPAVRLRSDRVQCDKSLFEPAGLFADLGNRDQGRGYSSVGSRHSLEKSGGWGIRNLIDKTSGQKPWFMSEDESCRLVNMMRRRILK